MLALVLAVLVAAIWVLPGMLDWNRYRSSVAALVSAGIGRPVEITGNITLHLLPQPILTASGLTLADAGDGVVMEAHEVRLRVALGPLLGGRVDARELVLRGADLRLPWPPPGGALSRRPPAWLTGLQARVEQSRLQVGNLVITDVDANLGADPETGTLSAAGSAKILGFTWHFTTRLGNPGRDDSAPIDVTLDGQGKLRDTGGTFSGVLAEDGGLSGRIAARGPDLSQIMSAPAVAWRGDGRLSASGGLAVADDLSLEIDGSPARGAVALRVQPDVRLDLAITAGRIDLDAWAPILSRVAQSGISDIPIGVDLSTEAATLAGGTLRHVRSTVEVDQGGMMVREFSATLPGDAAWTVRGRFPRTSRGAVFAGTTHLVAPDLRGTLRWLAPFAPALLGAVPDQTMRTCDVTAKIAFDAAQFSVTDLKGVLDGAAAQGGLALRLGARPGISAGLTLDRVSLDPWLPDMTLLSKPGDAYATFIHNLATAGFDADVKLQAQKASWQGVEIGPMSLDAQTEGARLTLRRLEVSFSGVHGTVSGTLGEGGRVSEGRVELTTQDIAALRPFLPASYQPTAGILRGSASLLIQASGPPEAMLLRATSELNDLRLEAQPTINLPAHRWSGSVTIHHPGAPRLFEQLGFKGMAPWIGDGSFSIIAQIAATRGHLDLTSVDTIAGQFRAAGQISLTGNVVSGRVQAETLTLPMPYPRSPEPLSLQWLQDWTGRLHLEAAQVLVDLVPVMRDAVAELSFDPGRAGAQLTSASLSGGTVAGTAKVELGEKPRLALDATLTNVDVAGPLSGGTLDLGGGTMQAQIAVAGEGFSPAALAATLSGKGSITVRNARVIGVDLPAARTALANPVAAQVLSGVRTALAGGESIFSTLTIPFDVARGVVSLHASGDAGPAKASLEGTLDLLGGVSEGQLMVQSGGDLPNVGERLSGPATMPSRTPELAAVARWLAERP